MGDTLELVINDNESINEFLEHLMAEKSKSGNDVVGSVNGFQFSTNDCDTIEELRSNVAYGLGEFIRSNKKVADDTIPKRLRDLYTYIFDKDIDEDIIADNMEYVDFDDPNSIVDWIDTAADALNNPQFARLTFKNGKTAAEKMVELLEEKGYGHPSQADDPMTQAINEKMNDLREFGYLVNNFLENQPIEVRENNQPIINPEPIKEEEPVINNNNFQQVPKDGEFRQHSFFQKLPKSNEKSTFQTMSKEKEDSVFENTSNQQQKSTENSLNKIGNIRQQFNIPSENINENKSAIMLAIGSGDAHDIEVAKAALQAIPDNDPEKAMLASELQKIIDMQSPVDNTIDYDKEIQSIEDNIYEIKKEMARLLEREKKNIARIKECGEILKQPKPNLITQLNNINYQNNFEESKKRILRQNEFFSKEIVENAAMPFYNKAIETHDKEDIIEAFVKAERLLESGHLYREPIQSAMRAMVPVYYPGQTLDDLLNENRAQKRFEDGKKHIEGLNRYIIDKKVTENAAMPFYNRALETKTKEDILKALEESEKLENSNGGYKEAIRNTLEGMVPVYYPGQTLNDLINAKEANNHLEKEIQHIKTMNNFYDKSLSDAAMPFYNKAMETHDKEDIIKAVAAAERNLSFGNPYIGAIQNAMQALVAVYYPGKTLEDLMNEKRQKKRAKESEEQVQRYKSILGEDEITNTAMSFYNKALETKDINDVVTALQEINRLPDNNLVKQPMLDALNYNLNINQETSTGPKKEEIKKEFDQLIAENNEIHNKIMELGAKESKLGEEKTRLMEEQEKAKAIQENNNSESESNQEESEEEQDLSQGDNGSGDQGDQSAEENEEEMEEEPPMRVVSDKVNQNLGLWKKAILGIDKALGKIKLSGTGKVIVAVVATSLFGIYTAAAVCGTYYFIRKKAKKYKKELEEQQNIDDEEYEDEYEDEYEEEEVEEQEASRENEETHQNQQENQDEFDDLTNKIIQEGMKAVTPRVQYYRSSEENKWNTINSENQEQEKSEILDAISDGENIGYKIVEGNNEQTPEVQLIDDYLLLNYIQDHQASLPTVDEIASVNAQTSSLQNKEEMGRGM